MSEIRKLYENYHNDIFRYLIHLTGDADLAEELTSETFLSAITALPGFRGDTDIKRWLLTIARNKWFDYLRRRKEHVCIEEERTLVVLPTPEEWAFQRLAVNRFWELLDEEEPRAGMVVKMRLEGYSFYEIGEALGIRENAARVLEFRVRNRLRNRLIQEGYDETV